MAWRGSQVKLIYSYAMSLRREYNIVDASDY
jgi:hypothetical protein